MLMVTSILVPILWQFQEAILNTDESILFEFFEGAITERWIKVCPLRVIGHQ